MVSQARGTLPARHKNFDFKELDSEFFNKMAEHTGLPLDAYNRTTPPGWRPSLTHYPFRRYLDRLRLWYRMTDLEVVQIGPAVAGRLQGRPYNMALSLRFATRAGVVIVGDEALAFAGEPAALDAMGQIVAPAIESGIQQLIRLLARRYGADNQQTSTSTIDQFEDLRRGRLSLLEYLAEFEHLFVEANLLGGLELNPT